MKDYDKLWYKCLDKQIKTDIAMYKKIDLHDKERLMRSKKHHIINIKNNILQGDRDLGSNFEGRWTSLYNLIDIAINYSITNNLPSINGTFFFRMADGYDFEYNYPTLIFSKPKNKPGLLYPDFNFLKIFDKIKIFNKNCKGKKNNEIFFRGSSTSKKRSRIREKMAKLSKPFNIKIGTDYVPYYYICKYKYVLDIPGTKPWSVRLIELYMSKSLPIRIQFYNKKWGENIWIQFYENMFPNKESYIGFSYNTNYDKEVSDNIFIDIKKKCIITYNHFNEKPKLFNYITNNNFKKVKSLTLDHIGYYMYNILISYSKLLKS